MIASKFFADLDEETSSSTPAPKKEKSSSKFFSDLDEEPSRKRSLLNAPAKGLLRSKRSIPKDPLHQVLEFFTPKQSAEKEEMEERLMEQFLPTQKGKTAESFLEAAGEYAPSFALGEGGILSKLQQIATAAGAKTGLKEAGAPEVVQELGAGISTIAPGALAKMAKGKFIPTKSQEEIYDFLKGKGMKDKDIIPIIQNEKKVGLLSKVASKGGRLTKIRENTKNALGSAFEEIRSKGKNIPVTGKAFEAFEKDFMKVFEDIPYNFKDAIKKDVEHLFSTPITFSSMRDFDRAVNDIIKGKEGGKAVLGLLKAPIRRAQVNIAPELSKELSLTKEAYKKGMRIAEKLDPTKLEGLLAKGGEPLATAYGLVTHSPAILGLIGSRIFARELLINPRLQNYHLHLIKAINQQKLPQVARISKLIMKEIQPKIDQELKGNTDEFPGE